MRRESRSQAASITSPFYALTSSGNPQGYLAEEGLDPSAVEVVCLGNQSRDRHWMMISNLHQDLDSHNILYFIIYI
jgi:hypothetical protein